MARRRTPSNAITAGTIGGALAAVVIESASAWGYPVTPGLAAALTTLCVALVGYYVRGGRKDEIQ